MCVVGVRRQDAKVLAVDGECVSVEITTWARQRTTAAVHSQYVTDCATSTASVSDGPSYGYFPQLEWKLLTVNPGQVCAK